MIIARKPIHIEAAGAYTPRERTWAAIRTLKRFTLEEVSRRARVDPSTASTYLRSLVVAEILGEICMPEKPCSVFVLNRDMGIDAPRVRRDGTIVTQGRGNLFMWRTMKILREFDVRELARAASTEDVQVAEATAKTYVQFLTRAGYLSVIREAKPGTPARYRFVRGRNTGPRPPQIQRVKQVFDANLGKVVWAPDPLEVADEH